MCLYGSSRGDQSTALPKTSRRHSTTQIRTVPMHASLAWLSCEPCDVRVGVYIVFAYGVKHASMGRYCGDYAQVQGYSFRKSHSFHHHFNNVLIHYQMLI